MEKRNTKEVIMFESLKLFADRGYDGVSMRDIASKAGIMQSSLYKHYRSKQEIFDSLVSKMMAKFNDFSSNLELTEKTINDMAKEYVERGSDFLIELSASLFELYLNDNHAAQFRKMLSIERYGNASIDAIYRQILIDSAIDYQTALFSEMIKQGHMKNGNAEAIALQFYSPIFLLINKYDGLPSKIDEALKALKNHITQFESMYRRTAE